MFFISLFMDCTHFELSKANMYNELSVDYKTVNNKHYFDIWGPCHTFGTQLYRTTLLVVTFFLFLVLSQLSAFSSAGMLAASLPSFRLPISPRKGNSPWWVMWRVGLKMELNKGTVSTWARYFAQVYFIWCPFFFLSLFFFWQYFDLKRWVYYIQDIRLAYVL